MWSDVLVSVYFSAPTDLIRLWAFLLKKMYLFQHYPFRSHAEKYAVLSVWSEDYYYHKNSSVSHPGSYHVYPEARRSYLLVEEGPVRLYILYARIFRS